MTKQELINELNKRQVELGVKCTHAINVRDDYNGNYFKGAYNEVTNIKYFIEAYWKEDNNCSSKKKKFLVIHSDKYGRYNTICTANNYEDLLKDWGCFNNTYIDKIYDLGDMVYEEKR